MTTRTERILDALRQHGHTPKKASGGWTCCCPAHEDRNPSLSIKAGEDGRVLVYCHSHNCPAEAIVKAVGLGMADLMPDSASGTWKTSKAARKPLPAPQTYKTLDDALAALARQPDHENKRLGKPDQVWDYHDRGGDIVGVVVRWDPPGGKKEIRQASVIGDGWTLKAMPEPRPLYRLNHLAKLPEGATVYVLEGEKAVDAAIRCGLVATTSTQGSQSAGKTDWSPLRGMNVVILPDNDDPGVKYAETVANLVNEAQALSVKLVRLVDHWPNLPAGGDLADVLDTHKGGPEDLGETVQGLAGTAECHSFSFHPQGCELKRNESEPYKRPWRIYKLSELGPSKPPEWIWPGYVARGAMTLLTSKWKAGKSTLIRHLLQDLHRGGGLVPDPIDDLRVLVMTEETCDQWCRARDTFDLDDDRVLILRHGIHSRPSAAEWADEWMRLILQRVNDEKIGLVVIDTISAFWPVRDENSAVEVTDALRPLRAFTDAGVALLLIHHPKKGESTFDDAARGSGAMSGFPDFLMTMEQSDKTNSDDRRRVLKVKGRFDDLPPETVIELTTDDEYVVIGARADAKAADLAETVVDILAGAGTDGMTHDEVFAIWPGNRPSGAKIRAALNSPTGRWKRTGEGKKNSPHRYHPITQDSFRFDPDPYTRNENESSWASFDTAFKETRP